MTAYRFWNWDVLDSKAAIDIAASYLENRSEVHERHVENLEDVELEHREIYDEILEEGDVSSVDRYVFSNGELDVVEIDPGIYLLGDEEYAEEAEKILRSGSPSRIRRKMERKRSVEEVKSILAP